MSNTRNKSCEGLVVECIHTDRTTSSWLIGHVQVHEATKLHNIKSY